MFRSFTVFIVAIKLKYKSIRFFFIFSKKDMKCLLCSSKFKDQQELLDHYLPYHNIDENTCFFQKLFQSNGRAFLKNCIRCNQFLVTQNKKAVHDFLEYYNEGKSIPFEEKPLDIVRYPALTICQIEFKKYNNFYAFFNSEKCEFLLQNVKQRFQASTKKWFRCSFIIENTQNSIRPDLQPLLNTRYWTTETYDSIYFNDFIFHALKQDILKRAIKNKMSGSSWYFKRFVYLAVKILDGEVEISI